MRATNWVGDAVMSLPALRAIRERFPAAEISILAKPWVAGLYRRESFCNRLIPYSAPDFVSKWRVARELRAAKFDCAILLQNAFEAAAIAFVAGIPERVGYARDGRSALLTKGIAVPRPGEIARHQRFYYLELLRRAGIITCVNDQRPSSDLIRLEGASAAHGDGIIRFHKLGLGDYVIGVSPGAAYGSAKRWLPERFAETANRVASDLGATVAIFGSKDERELCEAVAAAIHVKAWNFAGETTLAEFIDMAAACRVYLTNDSGAMHIASALGVPTVAVFGATDDIATGPTGPLARVIREQVECSPCLLRECPIDHRCMTRVDSARVAEAALDLLKWKAVDSDVDRGGQASG